MPMMQTHCHCQGRDPNCPLRLSLLLTPCCGEMAPPSHLDDSWDRTRNSPLGQSQLPITTPPSRLGVHIPFKNRKAVGGTVSANRCYPSGDPPAKQPNLPVVVTFFHRSWLPVEAAGYGDVTIVRSPEKCIPDDSINESMTDASYLAEA
jgi:hypothetical protein